MSIFPITKHYRWIQSLGPVFVNTHLIQTFKNVYRSVFNSILLTFSLNSIYFQISIYTWQHTSIQIHGKCIGKQVA